MKALVDSEICVGTGSCESLCPEVFELGPESVAEVKVDEVPPELEDGCREAANSCPVDAIRIEE